MSAILVVWVGWSTPGTGNRLSEIIMQNKLDQLGYTKISEKLTCNGNRKIKTWVGH